MTAQKMAGNRLGGSGRASVASPVGWSPGSRNKATLAALKLFEGQVERPTKVGTSMTEKEIEASNPRSRIVTVRYYTQTHR